MSRIQKGLAHPFERVEREQWVDGRDTCTREREREREGSKEEASERRYLFAKGRTRKGVRRDIYMCFPFVRDLLDALGSSRAPSSLPIIREAFSSATPRRLQSLYPRAGPFLGHGHRTATESSEKLDPAIRLFCKVLFFRNAGPTIVFPRRALALSAYTATYRFLQSGRVI